MDSVLPLMNQYKEVEICVEVGGDCLSLVNNKFFDASSSFLLSVLGQKFGQSFGNILLCAKDCALSCYANLFARGA